MSKKTIVHIDNVSYLLFFLIDILTVRMRNPNLVLLNFVTMLITGLETLYKY